MSLFYCFCLIHRWSLRLYLVRVKVFPENRYFSEMLFSEKENVFMCLIAFQKMFRKIFSNVWLCSWKYHKKYIFYLLLTFSRLPNEYIISFIPQNTNKTQKKIIKSEQTKARSRSRSQSTRSQSQSRLARSRSARSRPRSTLIGAMPVITLWCLGRSLIGVWFADRRLVRRCDRRLDRSLSLSLSLPLSLSLHLFAECVLLCFVRWVCFSLLRVLRKMFEGKTIL